MSRAEIPIDRKIVAFDRNVPVHIEVRRSVAPESSLDAAHAVAERPAASRPLAPGKAPTLTGGESWAV